jgi:hypothetical protein
MKYSRSLVFPLHERTWSMSNSTYERETSIILNGVTLKSAPGWTIDLTLNVKYEWVMGGIGAYEFWGARCIDIGGGWEWVDYRIEGIKATNGSTTLTADNANAFNPDFVRGVYEDYGINLYDWINEVNESEIIQDMIIDKCPDWTDPRYDGMPDDNPPDGD